VVFEGRAAQFFAFVGRGLTGLGHGKLSPCSLPCEWKGARL
jgi:hypothetical protein